MLRTCMFLRLLFFDTLYHKMANVLLICLCQSIRLNIVMAQWLKYRACELQIMSLNPPGAFVIFTESSFWKFEFFIQNWTFYCVSILFINNAIYYNQIIQGVVSLLNEQIGAIIFNQLLILHYVKDYPISFYSMITPKKGS